jgi:hypothetical protein
MLSRFRSLILRIPGAHFHAQGFDHTNSADRGRRRIFTQSLSRCALHNGLAWSRQHRYMVIRASRSIRAIPSLAIVLASVIG